MKTVSKQELLKLIDNHLPDDARIALFSSMAFEVFEVNEEQMGNMFGTVEDVFGDTDDELELGDTTHVIGGA